MFVACDSRRERNETFDSPAFEDADLRVLSQLTLAPGDVSVAVTVVGGIGGTDHRLVRMDLTKLVRDVNHHFESYIDGHDRKCVHGTSAWRSCWLWFPWMWLRVYACGLRTCVGSIHACGQVSTAGVCE